VLFLYIVLGSWFGLLPGILYWGYDDGKNIIPYLRAPTTDLSATTALAITAFLTIQYAGISALGVFGYIGKFITFKSGPGGFILGLFEILQEITRLISFSFRLFGNIFAGEVLLVVISYLTRFNDTSNPDNILNFLGVPAPSLVILFEFFVAIIQAYVFVNLMVVFIAMASEEAHGSDDHGDKEEHAQIEEAVAAA
jgi:F-type H+-transporting ATPase subunit a